MVSYRDPEEYPELGVKAHHDRRSTIERLRAMREKNSRLSGVEAIESAREVALRKLDARAHSRSELLTAITSRGFTDTVAREVVDRLEKAGLVDDQQFANMLVRERFSQSGKSGRALVEDLRRKGFTSQIIDEAMRQITTEDEEDRARQLVDKKMRSMRGVTRDQAYRRLAGMLGRKGYPPGVATAIIRDALAQHHWGNPDSDTWEGSDSAIP
ncbi:regulatory protein RecX [Schaalia sp. ZJ1691]|uniref:regulatory protein RecX n=1 Tax=Schaalia sp. ZJ1691 TaxID=2709404 RepID=UPI0013ECBECF|nr:regulatory protein RecX [Schaalia sp. ZJ1691]